MSVLDPTSESAAIPAVAAPRPEPRRAHLTARRWLALAPLADALVLALAVVVERLGGRYVGADSLSIAWMVGFPLIVITLLASRGFYRERLRLQLLDEIGTIAGAQRSLR